MGFDYFKWMKSHVGHKLSCVFYGDSVNDPDDVCIECETCGEVLFSAESLCLEDKDNKFVDEVDFDYDAEV